MKTWIVAVVSMYLCISTLLAANCDSGWYIENEDCVQCPENYPHSIPNADSINDCYLMTDVGKYVAGAGVAQAPCPENYYCSGGAPVAYDMRDRFHPIEYIKSTGTQYINTGILLGSDVDTEMVFETGSVSGDQSLFGVYSTDLHYWLNGYNNNAYIRYNDYHPVGEYVAHLLTGVKLMLEIRHGDWILNGKTIYSNSGVFDIGAPGYLFAAYRVPNEEVKWPHKSLKVYSFVQWRDGKKVIDLIPIYDSVRDECGMLDLVTGNFFGNIGTGKFECGTLIDDVAWLSGAVSCAMATDNAMPYSPAGSDDVSDCGYIMHIGENRKLYLRSQKRVSPSLAVQVKNRTFYADTSPEKHGNLRAEYNGQVLSIYNMDVDD